MAPPWSTWGMYRVGLRGCPLPIGAILALLWGGLVGVARGGAIPGSISGHGDTHPAVIPYHWGEYQRPWGYHPIPLWGSWQGEGGTWGLLWVWAAHQKAPAG